MCLRAGGECVHTRSVRVPVHFRPVEFGVTVGVYILGCINHLGIGLAGQEWCV